MDDLKNIQINNANINLSNIMKIRKFSSIDSDIQMLNEYLDTEEWFLLSVASGVYPNGEAYHSFILGRKKAIEWNFGDLSLFGKKKKNNLYYLSKISVH